MTYAGGITYPLLPTSHAGSFARVQANAPSLLASRTATTSRFLSGTTFAALASACLRNTARRNRRRCFAPQVSRYAPTSTSIAASSTVSRGICSADDGGNKSPTMSTTPDTTPPPPELNERGNCGEVKPYQNVNQPGFTVCGCSNVVNQTQPASRMGSAVGAVNGRCPPASSLHRATPHAGKAGLNPDPSLLSIMPRQPSQGCRCVSVLRLSRPFAAVGSPQVFITRNPNPPLKAHSDNVAHRLVSSVAALAERHPVIQQ